MANKNKNEALVKALLNLTASKIDNSKMANQLKGFPQGMGSKQGVYKLPADYNVKNEIKDAALLANSFAPVTGDIQSGVMAANDLKQGNYGSAALNGLGLLPFVPSMAGMIASKGDKVADAIRPLTQYELAQHIAQKNAVEMLGLPPNNTAMDRAKAMGFDVNNPVYHGTDKSFDAFDINKIGSQTSMPLNFPKGIYTSPNVEVSLNYGKGEGQNVIPLLMNKQNPISITDDITSAEAFKRFNAGDVDTFLSNNVAIARNPNQLRSRFAAFDPARAHEADLLGSITPEMAGLLAVGSGAGVGYAYNKKEKKTK